MKNTLSKFNQKNKIWKKELVDPCKIFNGHIDSTVTFFGSARIEEGHPLEKYYHDTYDIAKGVGDFIRKNDLPNAISSGGGPGIMKAVNKGAHDSGVPSLGMTIELPFEEEINEFIDEDGRVDYEYFFTRKYWCLKVAKIVIAIPGGVGTLDEVLETLVLLQTDKMHKEVPVILYGKEFWKRAVDFEYLKECQLISSYDQIIITDTVPETIDLICKELK